MSKSGRNTSGMPEAFAHVVELAVAIGAKSIKDLEGCWEHQVDERWWVAVNGHLQPVQCSHGGDVPPGAIFIEFNGWPVGIVDMGGGVIAAGELANEQTFIAAVTTATEAILAAKA